jgi:hypothetical protein
MNILTQTPDGIVELVRKELEREIKQELEYMRDTIRAIESTEFARRIEKAVERVLSKHNISAYAEYYFDEYPTVYTFVRLEQRSILIDWEEIDALDTIKIVGGESHETIAELYIHYTAYILVAAQDCYIKLKEIIDTKIEVGE